MAHLPPILEDFERREEKGCVRLARLMDVAPQTWCNWVNGTAVPTRRKAKHLASLLERPGLPPQAIIDLIDQDRTAHAEKNRAAREAAAGEPVTTSTRRIDADDQRADAELAGGGA